MTDKQYYTDKLTKLQQKANANLQKFINSAFDMVAEAGDVNERIREIQDILKTQEVEKPPKK